LAKPNWFAGARFGSRVLPDAVFLIRLALIIGSFIELLPMGEEQRSILADFESRLIGTGYVFPRLPVWLTFRNGPPATPIWPRNRRPPRSTIAVGF
jgi:hypothetical protein